MTHRISHLFKAALAASALLALSSCATDATSDLAYDSLDAADSKSSIVDLGYAAAARGDHTTAIQYFRSAHAKNLAYTFASAEPLVGLGQSLLAIGQNADAAKVFIKAAKAGGGSPALRGLAQAQLHNRQPGLAVESARRAVQLDPSDPKAVGILGVALDVLGDHQGAQSVYSDAMSQFPGSLSLAANHGLSMVMTGDMEAGVRLLEDVVRDPRATARDRQNLALAYALSGDYDKGAALASIDLDVSGVKANLLYADMLRAMNPRARLATLVVGAQAPKTDKSQNANAAFIKGDNAAWVDATVRRLVPMEGSADLAGVPPLMDPTGWAVQIAAYRKLEHLAPGWSYLSSKYASIIGGLEPRRSEVNHPKATRGPVGFFYRLNAGPLRTKQEAVDVCTRMKARGAQCWVRPPTSGEGRLPGSDRMANNGSDAESAMVASSDYNAVVNQFARSMVMKSRKDAPASTRQLPPIMMAETAPAEMPEPVEPAPMEPAPMEKVAATDVPVLAIPAAPEPQLVEATEAPAPKAPVQAEKTMKMPAAIVPVTQRQKVPTKPAFRRAEAATAEAELQPARLQNLSNIAPSASPADAPADVQTLTALGNVFDAVEEAEALPQPAPKFAKDPAYDNATSVQELAAPTTNDAPSPGKIIPAMTRFTNAPSNTAQVSQSGAILPSMQNSGVPLKEYRSPVQNGVY